MKRRLFSFILACAIILSIEGTVNAANVDYSGTSANTDAALVAADYAVVGGELTPASALPSSYSSKDMGYTTAVRQQLYNTCWAYSSTAALESNLLMQDKRNSHLSTMFMNYWGTTESSGYGWQRGYLDGGYPYIALGFMTSFGEVTEEMFNDKLTLDDYNEKKDSLYPYTSVSDVVFLDGTDKDTIKTAIYEYGGVVGNFHYDSACISNDYSSYFCDTPNLTTAQLAGHAVELVGWDDNYSASHFNSSHRPSSNGAWLCKNSWGKYFAEDGYFWISYEDLYLFDSRFGPSYTISGTTDMTSITKIQQNEIYGATYEFNYLSNSDKDITYINILDFSDGYHNIDKVVFESTAEGSQYTAYYIPVDDDGAPVADESTWSVLGEGTIDYQGYISIDTNGFNAPEKKCGIGIRIHRDSMNTGISIGVAEWLSSNSKYLFKPETKSGDCYIIGFTKKPIELKNFYSKYLNDEIGGSFVIKAVCHSDEAEGDVDGDGELNIMDITLVQRMEANMMTLNSKQMRFADIDNDGECDIIDCTIMQCRLLSINANQMLDQLNLINTH